MFVRYLSKLKHLGEFACTVNVCGEEETFQLSQTPTKKIKCVVLGSKRIVLPAEQKWMFCSINIGGFTWVLISSD